MRLTLDTFFSGKDGIVRRLLKITPATLVVFSFVFLILFGTGILMLPVATHSGITFIDALFTATSAVCVTGLVVVDTGSFFTTFGQWCILIMIQIGGLGVMTISVMMFQVIGHSVSFRQRMIMQDVFAHTPRQDILQVVRTILVFTVILEGLGFLFFFTIWWGPYSFGQAAYLALFHSISAFCNAGFSLFAQGLTDYSANWPLNLSMSALIVLGGIGFPVVYDVLYAIKTRKPKRIRLSVQTRTVLWTTTALIVSGAAAFFILEFSHTLSGKPLGESILISIFQSITCRTAGFNTVDISVLNSATLMMMSTLMFFGASPGSTGGGVKTTTLMLLIAFTWARIKRRKRVNLFKKSIPVDTVNRSVSLTLVCIGLIGTVLFLILAGISIESGPSSGFEGHFLVYLFESVSAFGTVGLSMGVTPILSAWGKSLIILLMLVGRAGVLTFAYIVIGGRRVNGIEYSEENIMIG